VGSEMKKTILKDMWGSYAAAARSIGVTRATISQWPDELTPRLQARVVFAALREGKPIPSHWLKREKSA